MGLDEQKEEREVLQSIFPDEIAGSPPQSTQVYACLTSDLDISETSFRISIVLDVQDLSDDPPEAPVILLNVTYPEAYPDVGPYLDITSPPNATKHPLIDVAEDKGTLLEVLEPTIEESLGMAMVFTLVTTLKEAAEMLIEDRQQAAEDVRAIEKRKEEEVENRKFHGTAVTKESFLDWRANFKKEMQGKREHKEGRGRSGR